MESNVKKPGLLTGVGVGILLSLPLVGLFSAVNALFGLPLVPSDLMDTLPNVLPVELLNFGKEQMVNLLTTLNLARLDVAAKPAELIIGTFTLIALCAVVIGAAYFFARRSANPTAGQTFSLGAGLVLGGIMALVHAALPAVQFSRTGGLLFYDSAFILLAFGAFGYAAGWVHSRLTALNAAQAAPAAEGTTVSAQQLDRRQFLVRVGGSAAVLTVAGAVVGLSGAPTEEAIVELPDVDPNAAAATVEESVAQVVQATYDPNFEAAPGTRDEYTPLAEHYRIDIVQNPPEIDGVAWRLPITGLVANLVEWTLDDLREMPSVSQIITMSCISNPVGGPLISTTKWTGVPMSYILEQVQPSPDAVALKITCADGFDEYVRLDLLNSESRIMLAYAWDDRPLLQKHGFPVRIHIPDLYGMKQPKWITNFEFVSEWDEGYWVRRGWSAVARVQHTAVIDTIATTESYEVDGKRFVPIGGMAYAGARGISKVEVRIGDDGEWQEATLKEPLSDRTWFLWRYDWEYVAGAQRFYVRCIDGTGVEQVEASAPVRPDGATGYHQKFQIV